jgi:hypothetical protein
MVVVELDSIGQGTPSLEGEKRRKSGACRFSKARSPSSSSARTVLHDLDCYLLETCVPLLSRVAGFRPSIPGISQVRVFKLAVGGVYEVAALIWLIHAVLGDYHCFMDTPEVMKGPLVIEPSTREADVS